MIDIEDLIRQRAYELWEQSGKVQGSEMEFWLEAETEIKQAEAGTAPAAPTQARDQRST